MITGRPTDYTPEVLEKAQAYFDDMYTAHKEGDGAYPSIAELALQLGVHRDTIYEWSKVHDEFSDIVKKIMTLQELSLHDNGLLGKFNASITKLMLTKHGYTDKQDVTSGGKPFNSLKELSDAELESIANGGKEGTS